jgi:flagellar M-ring protein FliF
VTPSTNNLSQTLRDLPAAWGQLGRTRQMIVGGVAGAIVLAVVAALFLFQSPKEAPLYSNLNDADASAIVAKLKELKVPYTVSDGGSTILVSQSQQADLRLQLAGAGLPSGGGVGLVGMEVFDKTNFGITDFAQKLNFQRALEGELTKTISRLSPVESARVHLVLPAERLFSTQQKDTTASVVIKLKAAARLTDEQVGTIKNLVSRSVEGLTPANVAVMDVNGNSLGRADTGQVARDREAATRLDLQRQRETEMESKIQGMLTQALGPNKAIVRANINLDWDAVTRNVENYTAGATLSRQDNREQMTGTGAQIAAPGGVPGTQSNIPTFQTTAGGATDQSSYTSSRVTENNVPNKEVQTIAKAPGDIKSMGIAVMVDQSVQAAQVDQITQLVTAAAGIQPTRGDQVSVVTLPFDNTLRQQLATQQEEAQRMDWFSLGLRLTGVLFAFGGLAILFLMMWNAVRPRTPKVVVQEPVSLPGGSVALLPPQTVQAQLAEAMQSTRSREEMEAMVREELRSELRSEIETQVRSEVMTEVDAEVQAQREELEQKRLEQERKRQQDELIRAAEEAKQMAVKREQMREALTKLASTKPDAMAEVIGSWLEQSRAAAAPAPRRATSAIN